MAAEHGLASGFMPMPLSCGTGPATLAGNLVVQNAEALSGVVLLELAYPGAPVFFSGAPSVIDLKTGGYTGGSPEDYLLAAAATQLAHFYGLPMAMGTMATGAKEPDWQAAVDDSLSTFASVMSCADMMNGCGLLNGSKILSYPHLVMETEIYSIVQKMSQGITVDEESLALDVIEKVGPNGTYLAERHTRRHMKEIWRPTLFDRTPYDSWLREGKQGALGQGDRDRRADPGRLPAEPLSDDLQAELAAIVAPCRCGDGSQMSPEVGRRARSWTANPATNVAAGHEPRAAGRAAAGRAARRSVRAARGARRGQLGRAVSGPGAARAGPRRPQRAGRAFGAGHSLLAAGGLATAIRDAAGAESRPITEADVDAFCRVADACRRWLWWSHPACPAPKRERRLASVARAFTGTRQARPGGVWQPGGDRAVIEMATGVAGGPDELKRRPLVTIALMPEAGAAQPAWQRLPVCPVWWLWRPRSLRPGWAAALAESFAAAFALVTGRSPGIRARHGPCGATRAPPGARRGRSCLRGSGGGFGARLRCAAHGDRAGHARGVPDWLASAENTYATLVCSMAGVAGVAGAGLLDAGASVSLHELIMDAEIFSYCSATTAGISVDDETIALETIEQVGIGGNALGERHTRRHMREVWRPVCLTAQRTKPGSARAGASPTNWRTTSRAASSPLRPPSPRG